MKNKHLFLVLILNILVLTSLVPTIKAATITIHLQDSSAANGVNSPLTIKVYSHYIQARSYIDGRTMISYGNKGVYHFDLSDLTEECHVFLSLFDNPKEIKKKLFLLEPDDHIQITKKTDAVVFNGKGSLKWECQYALYKEPFILFKSNDPANGLPFADKIQLVSKKIDSIAQRKQKIISRYKLNALTRKKMTLENWSDIYLGQYESYKYHFMYSPEPIRSVAVANYKCYYRNQSIDTSNVLAKMRSRSYADALLQKTIADAYCDIYDSTIKQPAISFMQLLDQINKRFSGLLWEKVVTIFFTESFSSNDSTDQALIKTISKVTTPFFKAILQEIMDRSVRNKPVYPFELPDINNNIVRLSDFKGKVIIIDFWFTGCTSCSKLAKDMMRIVEHYKKDSNVAFISISVDTDSTIWKKSIASGLYTHQSSINLYTNGLGDQHPLARYYNQMGYPRLLLVSKQGTLISITPPRPSDDASFIAFIAMIDKALQ